MSFIFDIALAIIVLICAFIGKKKGFVRCVLNLVKSIAAFIIAKIFSDYAAKYVFENIIKKDLAGKINEALLSSVLPAKEAAWQAMPSFIRNILSNAGVDSENFLKLSSIGTSESIAQTSIEAVEEVIIGLISLILLILFFIIVSVLLGLIIKLIDKFFDLPILNSLNSFLGTIVGVVLGIFIIVLVCTYWNDLILIFPQNITSLLQSISETSKLKEILGNIL